MRIVVCLKTIRSELVDADSSKYGECCINPYDLLVLHKALELKAKYMGEIICISMGNRATEDLLRKCYAMGADRTILLCDSMFAGSDTFATSYILSGAIKRLSPDIVLCGEKAVDGETGQVPIGLAKRLEMTCVNAVDSIEECSEQHMIVCKKNKEWREVVKVEYPSLIVFRNFVREEPFISLMRLKKSMSYHSEIWNAASIGLEKEKCGLLGSKTKVVESKFQAIKVDTIEINGETIDKAKKIHSILS